MVVGFELRKRDVPNRPISRWWLTQATHPSVASSTAYLGASVGVVYQAIVFARLVVVERLCKCIEHELGVHRLLWRQPTMRRLNTSMMIAT